MNVNERKIDEVLVSVLIPVFNGNASLIKEALNSIRNQRNINYECILVDDSTDIEISRMLARYCKENKAFKHYLRLENDGLGAALNYGLKYCNGQFIARMDSDDLSVNDRLHTQALFLLNRSDVDIVGSNM